MLAHAQRDLDVECCGLLAGRGGVITNALPAVNALASATAFDIAPAELFRLFHHMRELGLDHLGIYHSHPEGENAPSRRDIECAYYPDAALHIGPDHAVTSTLVCATVRLPFQIEHGHAGDEG